METEGTGKECGCGTIEDDDDDFCDYLKLNKNIRDLYKGMKEFKNGYQRGYIIVVLYGCETWTLTLREEQRLRVFENKILGKYLDLRGMKLTGEWKKLHNAELHALYSSSDIIRNIKSRRLKWAGHVACMGECRNAYSVLVRRPKGKRPLGRPRHRWEDNIKMDLREVGYDDREWINLAQDRDRWRAYVRAAMNLRIPHTQEHLNVKIDVLKEARGNIYEEHQRFLRTFDPRWRTDENIMLILSAITLFTPERPRVVHHDVIQLEQDFKQKKRKREQRSKGGDGKEKFTFLKFDICKSTPPPLSSLSVAIIISIMKVSSLQNWNCPHCRQIINVLGGLNEVYVKEQNHFNYSQLKPISFHEYHYTDCFTWALPILYHKAQLAAVAGTRTCDLRHVILELSVSFITVSLVELLGSSSRSDRFEISTISGEEAFVNPLVTAMAQEKKENSYYYLLRRYLESIYPGCEARSVFLKLIQKITELHRLNDDHVRVYLDVNPKDVEPLLIEIFDLKPH
ncbi:hypothetical protein ANN_27150 [Periplaneta americana]|uniref:Uncharacterized protein n=1 Tax=Periplaneta americana TaxID=6978 RepID=A0ABQ8RX92_PERAM|nr:hypothetical protein ANN_27150 [Periplaneta americana]